MPIGKREGVGRGRKEGSQGHVGILSAESHTLTPDHDFL